jgi:hypothetical protein
MFYISLSKKIVSLKKRYLKYQSEYLKQLRELENQCKHEKVITLHSEYPGSYSHDYDDWMDEVRICLVCGKSESGSANKPHKILLSPFKRFEITSDKTYKETPLCDLTSIPLSKLLEWVEKNGYDI